MKKISEKVEKVSKENNADGNAAIYELKEGSFSVEYSFSGFIVINTFNLTCQSLM